MAGIDPTLPEHLDIQITGFNIASNLEQAILDEINDIITRLRAIGFVVTGDIYINRAHEPVIKKFAALMKRNPA